MKFRLGVSAFVVLLLMLGAMATASAARDRTPPTAPSNLRVPNVGNDYIALAWNASFDSSGKFSYRVYREGVSSPVTLPKTQRAYIWRNLEPGETYRFWVKAVDNAGNVSASSNIVTATTNGDVTPPSAPTDLTVTEVTSTSVSLAWEPATDDVGVLRYVVYVNNAHYAFVAATSPTSIRVSGLAHSTTHSFHVIAEDTSHQEGPASETVSATTLASADTTPPSAPSDLVATDYGCGLFELTWTAAYDTADGHALRYDVYVDGALAPEASVFNDTITEVQVPLGIRTFVVTATDRSGNTSEPSNTVTAEDRCA
jgi:chitinase